MVVVYDSYRLILFVFEIVFKFLFENSIGDFSTISLCVGSLQHLLRISDKNNTRSGHPFILFKLKINFHLLSEDFKDEKVCHY